MWVYRIMVARGCVIEVRPTASRCLVCTGDTDGGYPWPDRQEPKLSLNSDVLVVLLILKDRNAYYYMMRGRPWTLLPVRCDSGNVTLGKLTSLP